MEKNSKGYENETNKGTYFSYWCCVSGMTTALVLQRQGYKATIVADRYPPPVNAAGGYVSVVAGALWEYPPGVCGRHTNETSLKRSRAWSIMSYNTFDKLNTQGVPSVEMLRAHFYFPERIKKQSDEYDKMLALKLHTKGFRRGLHEERKPNLRFDDPPIRDAYSIIVPTIDTNKYMVWLQNQLKKRGVTMLEETIDVDRPLRLQEQALQKRFNVHAIVNYSGLGSWAPCARCLYVSSPRRDCTRAQ